jgi:hypothetical protein
MVAGSARGCRTMTRERFLVGHAGMSLGFEPGWRGLDVDDPLAFCRESQRVARRGYIETPGWLGDLVLRVDHHRWRVSRDRRGLRSVRSSVHWLGGHVTRLR